ncbi:MAG: hypothetical protein JWM33_1432 [Caulobacteraceae bacterium]|nr:hypothetical protein [Caulobacteraceae bacterium]
MADVHRALPEQTEAIGRSVVDACLHVHRTLGPGLLESVYELCLVHEVERRGHAVARQVALPVMFGDMRLEAGYRIDLLVDETVVVEVKALEVVAPVHQAQLLTYLKLSNRRLGYVVNFNVALMRQGIFRRVV